MNELLHGNLEDALRFAGVVLGHQGPGTEVYVCAVTVDGHMMGYRVAAAKPWPDYAWQAKVEAGMPHAIGVAVEYEVAVVLRKPVTAPPEVARHCFVIGHLRGSGTTSAAPPLGGLAIPGRPH